MTAPVSTSVIRQWARDNGLAVGDRGRLSPQVMSAYVDSKPLSSEAHDEDLASPLDGSPRSRVRPAVRIPVQPIRGATGIAHKVSARN